MPASAHSGAASATPPADMHELVARWSVAEASHDADTLATLLDADFRGVGPLGYVLDHDAWLRRFSDGLRYRSMELSEVEVREHGPVSVAVAVWDQVAEYQGHPTPGRFRTGLVAHRTERGWAMLGIQLSGPMPGPGAGRPPAAA